MPAALLFAFAGTFRSNGILLSGFILWGLLIQPFLENRKVCRFNCVTPSLTYAVFT